MDFWRPSQGTFAAIPPGGRFFCLVRGSPHESRVFGAMGFFREQHLMTAPEAWATFGAGTGASSLGDPIGKFDLPAERRIRHIVLDQFRLADTKVTTRLFAANTDISVAPSIQVGMAIPETAANWLESAIFTAGDLAVPDSSHLSDQSKMLAARNPDWAEDELVLALDLYFRRGLPGPTDVEVIDLSELLQRFGTPAQSH